MNKKLIISITIVLCLISWAWGYKMGDSPCKPKIIVKTEKVYDFTQSPEMINVYANTFGYLMVRKDDLERLKEKIEINLERENERASMSAYKKGFEKGYSDGKNYEKSR